MKNKTHRIRATALFAAGLAALSFAAAPPPVRAQDAPAIIGGKPVALTVTGEGETQIKPTGYVVSVLFYNDATGPEAAAVQNVQTEARLQQAALNAGIKPGEIKFFTPRQVGAPLNNGYVGAASYNSSGPPRANEPARAVRTMLISGSLTALPALAGALQKVGANGTITLTYLFETESALRNQTLKKAVADAVEQAKIMETASLPRHLQLVAMEPGEFFHASYTTTFPLSVPAPQGGEAPISASSALVVVPSASVHQSVTLRYALTDAPSAAKQVAKATPPKKAAPPKKN